MTWKNEKQRHSMSSRGISTKQNYYSKGKQNDNVEYLYANLHDIDYWKDLNLDEEQGDELYGELELEFEKYMENMEIEIFDKFGIKLNLYSALPQTGMIIGVEEWTDFDAVSNYGDFGLRTIIDDEKLMAKIIRYIGKKQDEFKNNINAKPKIFKYNIDMLKESLKVRDELNYINKHKSTGYDIDAAEKSIKLEQDFYKKHGKFPQFVYIHYIDIMKGKHVYPHDNLIDELKEKVERGEIK